MDRGYVDFQRLYALHFVPGSRLLCDRAKINLQFNRLESCPVDSTATECRSDQIVWLRQPRLSGITRTSCGASVRGRGDGPRPQLLLSQ